jgi:hypothetical protein
VGLLLAGCVGVPPGNPDRTDAVALENFTKFSGPPLNEFTYLGHYSGFRVVGERNVVVWTSMNDAYLLTVETPCPSLPFANGLGLTSTPGTRTVKRGFDYVRYNHGRCRIDSIRHVDLPAMKQAGVAGP